MNKIDFKGLKQGYWEINGHNVRSKKGEIEHEYHYIISGNYEDGLRDGVWVKKDKETNEVIEKITYRNGIKRSILIIDETHYYYAIIIKKRRYKILVIEII